MPELSNRFFNQQTILQYWIQRKLIKEKIQQNWILIWHKKKSVHKDEDELPNSWKKRLTILW